MGETKSRICIFHHSYFTSSGLGMPILKEQVELLQSTGLAQKADLIGFCITGDDLDTIQEAIQYILSQGSPFKILKVAFKDKDWEYFTLNEIQHHVTPEDKILFFHLKGGFNPLTTSWRTIMQYFCIELYHICLELLDIHDTVGCMFRRVPDAPCPHYSGTFWWARASYFIPMWNKYHPIIEQGAKNGAYRFVNEFCIMFDSPIAALFWPNDGFNGHDPAKDKKPEEYRNREIEVASVKIEDFSSFCHMMFNHAPPNVYRMC
jgi:hypothetical protein